jgi:hypothetical protein
MFTVTEALYLDVYRASREGTVLKCKIDEMLLNILAQFIAALLDRKQSDQLLPVVQ